MQDSCLMSTPVLIHFVLHATHFIFCCLVQGSVVDSLDWCQIKVLYYQQCQVEDSNFEGIMYGILSAIRQHQNGSL